MASPKKGKTAARTKGKPAARRPPAKKPAVKKSASPKAVPKAKRAAPTPPAKSTERGAAAPVLSPIPAPLSGARRHVLSLSFVRDGEEFLARLETNGGQISEFKNRALDQLLTLVANELEDLLE